MKKEAIVIDADYAVVIGHMRQSTRPGDKGLVQARVIGWEQGKGYKAPAQVKVTLAEPYVSEWSPHHPDAGKTEFVLETRRLICPWDEHAPAARDRAEREAAEDAAARDRDLRQAAATNELMLLIPPDLYPRWLGMPYSMGGGNISVELLLDIVRAVKKDET